MCGESQLDILLECGLVFLKGLERLKVGGIRAGLGYGLLRHLSLEIRRCESANSIHFIKIVSIVGQPISSTKNLGGLLLGIQLKFNSHSS